MKTANTNNLNSKAVGSRPKGQNARNERRIKCWSEIFGGEFQKDWWDDLGRYRTRRLFRGLPDSSWKLTTDLQRTLKEKAAALEPLLLRNFAKYAEIDADTRKSIWPLMVIARHHRLPTRLMDWTNSILVALHFVTINTKLYDKDGAIWAVNFEDLNKLLNKKHIPKKAPHKRPLLAKVFTVDELSDWLPNLDDLDALGKPNGDFMMFLEPPCIDNRFVNQYCMFSLMTSAEANPQTWLEKHPKLYEKIIIPADMKSDIRDALDQANITERVLFPGLDGLCDWLRRYYGPSTREEGDKSEKIQNAPQGTASALLRRRG
ncbi:MAG: FRG domain-containing protein [Candidatus Sumerlaeota bacterium]|nr:FRG domain-containing protein [Candidatus Sumerlaeota bacterium]